MPSIEQLTSFVATVESGSFSAAARKLGKVQSAVSQNIMNMEIDAGFQLFDRSSRYPTLTARGQKLLPQAKAVIAQHHRLSQQINTLESDEIIKLTLAIDEGIPYTNLIKLLPELEQAYPELELEFLCASSQDVIQLVIDKRATSGLVFSDNLYPESIDFETLGTVEFELMVSPLHPLAQESSNHIDILKLHRQLVISSVGSKVTWFNQAHSPDVWYADNYYVLLELAKSGFGWALLPLHLAIEALETNTLCKVPVQFEQLGWQANVDVIQHSAVQLAANDALRTILRRLLKM
ncbi:LysR family transcriptional regulator [Shewanella sp. D64]|uniref:LysR family transcriptional regulator n=1 Tax=unclassified Shewanella TaxID=196818 RepID=UPI0022BA2FC9|nr:MULTISPECIES: LysR family transcriptional regulator [unclassified Shewanella]MEC4728247.1 LysR family transcriptional regulator [Shewanella sp. D64]MEC4739299.1 LysR family transcriptional regulator [Shewanella sp. E94]WBJ97041.1 LysR family transcriptional regulator [Shewanella sp. MTB7]